MAPSTSLRLVVVSSQHPLEITYDEGGKPILPLAEAGKDALDAFNHPRLRRALIFDSLHAAASSDLEFVVPTAVASDLSIYASVHSQGLLKFLSTAWERWDSLGEEGQDPSGCMPGISGQGIATTPPLIPSNRPLPRDSVHRPSQHVIGQVGYYCTDDCTPIFAGIGKELVQDAATTEAAVQRALSAPGSAAPPAVVVYAVPTHPGHHAAYDSFGGYCYVNHVAAAARLWQTYTIRDPTKAVKPKVAILDVDYHAGNGTASIFYDDPTVLVVSIHCDPDFDYPFHSGFAEETGTGDGMGATLHLPLAPGATWKEYAVALEQATAKICRFEAQLLIISMGLDTYDQDPCTIRRAGFHLQGEDYCRMGEMIAKNAPAGIPTLFFQEGGYRMEKLGEAAANVLTSFTAHRC
ncbi:predicted protein [Phaeodactylum tricornutum CCAP 1055/1]|uniref:Histone deacetylase domain-containing protein n=1 Tax=Phaeodactylum tricornutum (strain CCAP 1055/1) TaxID=556484 RepID=B5Y4S0_PHATC|nr:predicted protein [Phaeodactylum tricornutum CCAP 1055/1]ACI65812.1 predicted protein [Phaeodactylum tricornutum CCAP 1055/1]|eukprot:XP_002186342.1 predicted protein [Phaeodactylum tricornutum CCAP 1055/1]